MTADADTLVLADGPAAEEIARTLDAAGTTHFADPYDALMEMGRRRWGAVLLTAGCPEFDGLCRAARRLQADTRLFALCSPAQGKRPAQRANRLAYKVATSYAVHS